MDKCTPGVFSKGEGELLFRNAQQLLYLNSGVSKICPMGQIHQLIGSSPQVDTYQLTASDSAPGCTWCTCNGAKPHRTPAQASAQCSHPYL